MASILSAASITRPSDVSSEDHDFLDDPTFDEAHTHGAFALSWEAHGLKYGLPASVDDTITGGRVAVANLSRGAFGLARAIRQYYRGRDHRET